MLHHLASLGISLRTTGRIISSKSGIPTVAFARRKKSHQSAVETLEERAVPSSIVVTNLGNEGPGTLRAAIAQADRHSGALTITFAPDLTGAIRLSAALPDLVTNINIVGPGPARLKVARNASHKTPQFRIFTIATGSSDTISGLTITGGSDSAGGGIENAGALVLKNDIISGNSATGTTKVPGTGGGVFNLGTLGAGGGVLNLGTLTVERTTIQDNSATGGPAFPGVAWGGGIYNSGSLAVLLSTVNGNTATGGSGALSGSYYNGAGGGIYNGGTATITKTTVSGNTAATGTPTAAGCGGGIFNADTLTVDDSALIGNTASTYRGTDLNVPFPINAGFGGGLDNESSATVENTTISGNTAGYSGSGLSEGGGIFSESLTMLFSTVTNNAAVSPTFGGGGLATGFASGHPVVMEDCIFQNSVGGNINPASVGDVESLGRNLFSDDPGIALNPTDRVDINPLLGPLATNGGPTLTQALLPGSPAIEAGAATAGITTDQRGLPRPEVAAPDIGAVQLQPAITSVERLGVHRHPTTLVVAFNRPINPASADDVANYRLVWSGPDFRFGTSDDRVIPIGSASYDPGTMSVTLAPTRRLALRDTYKLTIVGKPPTGLSDTTGLFLAGPRADQPGTNGVLLITGRLLVPPIVHGTTTKR